MVERRGFLQVPDVGMDVELSWNGADFRLFQRFEWVSMLCKTSRKGRTCWRRDEASSPKRAGVSGLGGYAIVLQN
jgi:hypothetical protein